MADRILKIGIIGSVIAAVCCFTPVLALVLGAVGLSGFLVYADLVLLPALILFLALLGFGLWKRRSSIQGRG